MGHVQNGICEINNYSRNHPFLVLRDFLVVIIFLNEVLSESDILNRFIIFLHIHFS